MFKKLFILIVLFCSFFLPALAVDETDIFGPAALFIARGDITSKKWNDVFKNKSGIVQFDITGENEISRFAYLGSFLDTIAQYPSASYDRKEYIYYNGYIEQRNLESDDPLAYYKLSGDTIYQYDNHHEKKKGLPGFLGYYEEGPGNLVASAKISDDGSMTKFDLNGKKLISFKITSPQNINLYNSSDIKTGEYHLLTADDITPTIIKSELSGQILSNSIIPVVILFIQNGKIKNQKWINEVEGIDFINCYDSNNAKAGYFNEFSNDMIYQYDKNNAKIGHFNIFSDSIYQYDADNVRIGHFNLFGGNIYQYDKNNVRIGYYSFFGDDIYHYDKNNREVGSFSIFGSLIYHYDRNGKKIQTFSLF